MDIFNKVKWAAGILLIFIIVLTTNLIDKGNFDRLRYSVITIYEDRIIANDLIFELSLLIQEKKIAAATSDSSFFLNENDEVNSDIRNLIERYEQTKLTSEERRIFDDLKEGLDKLKRLEKEPVSPDAEVNADLMDSINDIIGNLRDLSKVQLNEGKTQMTISNEAMDSIDVFTQVEIIFLIIMAVLIQIIILYKPKS